MVRALASHQCGPGSNLGFDSIYGLSLLLVLSFAPRDFSPGTPGFLSPQKPKFQNSNSIRESGRQRTTLWMCYLQIFIYSFIYLLIYYLLLKVELWFSQVTPNPLYENEHATVFWDVPLFADTTQIKANRIDSTIIDKISNQVRVIEMSCP